MDENYVYIDYYRSICIEGAPAIRADRAESILSKCREIIINWKENSGIYFPDGRCAPLLREESTNNETRFELSSAAEGNFLEAINMSLHVFEQHQKGYGWPAIFKFIFNFWIFFSKIQCYTGVCSRLLSQEDVSLSGQNRLLERAFIMKVSLLGQKYFFRNLLNFAKISRISPNFGRILLILACLKTDLYLFKQFF